MEFSQILAKLMSINGISAYRMSKDTGIPEATIGRWKNGSVVPSQEKLKQIAEYYNVSTDYLLGNEQKEKLAGYTDEQLRQYNEIINLYDKIPREKREMAKNLLKALLEE